MNLEETIENCIQEDMSHEEAEEYYDPGHEQLPGGATIVENIEIEGYMLYR